MSDGSEARPRANAVLDHPERDRFRAAVEQGGWPDGEVLPRHGYACYGCGPDNPAGFGLTAVAAPGGGVRAELAFDERFLGAPGLVHGGAVAGMLDDLFGMVLVRELIPAVTTDLRVSYRKPLHLHDACEARAWLVERDDRDLQLAAEVHQHDRRKVTAEATFRVISPERLANRYERT